MSSTSEPVHLNNHHRNTLRQVFQHPVSHNIEWHAVVSLLEAIGSVVEHSDRMVAVTVGSATEFFEVPAHKDIDTQTVFNLRRMLSSTGYGPAWRKLIPRVSRTDSGVCAPPVMLIASFSVAPPPGKAHRGPWRCMLRSMEGERGGATRTQMTHPPTGAGPRRTVARPASPGARLTNASARPTARGHGRQARDRRRRARTEGR